MLVRTLLTLAVMTTCAVAFHDNTYAVFELREQLLRLTLNLWELLAQLEYASDALRQRVYLDIAGVQSDIQDTMAELMRLDRLQHPASE
jgi:type II secretory pathway component PulK